MADPAIRAPQLASTGLCSSCRASGNVKALSDFTDTDRLLSIEGKC